MKSLARNHPIPMWSLYALALAGALAYSHSQAGEDHGATPDIAGYLRMHDEATRISAHEAKADPGAGAQSCVRKAEQAGTPRQEPRG